MRRFRRALLLLPIALGACSSLPIVGRTSVERWAFTAPWDPRSATSARVHSAALDAVVLDWIPLDSVTGMPVELYRDSVSATVASGVRRMALVTPSSRTSFIRR